MISCHMFWRRTKPLKLSAHLLQQGFSSAKTRIQDKNSEKEGASERNIFTTRHGSMIAERHCLILLGTVSIHPVIMPRQLL